MASKKIGLWDLVFMNISALFGIRWIAKSTASSFGLGLGAIPSWVVFAFIFFVPCALICAELASTYPRDGGLDGSFPVCSSVHVVHSSSQDSSERRSSL